MLCLFFVQNVMPHLVKMLCRCVLIVTHVFGNVTWSISYTQNEGVHRNLTHDTYSGVEVVTSVGFVEPVF